MTKKIKEGGKIRLRTFLKLERESPSIFIPHTVCGDFDSLNDYVFDEYKHYGIEVVETPDQNSTENDQNY